jgi:hypothetical protein
MKAGEISARVTPGPPPYKGGETRVHYKEGRMVAVKVSLHQLPFVKADLSEVRGLLEGAIGGPLKGNIHIVIHEGLVNITGELEAHQKNLIENLFQVILPIVYRRLAGLAAQFNTMNLRIDVEYVIKYN